MREDSDSDYYSEGGSSTSNSSSSSRRSKRVKSRTITTIYGYDERKKPIYRTEEAAPKGQVERQLKELGATPYRVRNRPLRDRTVSRNRGRSR